MALLVDKKTGILDFGLIGVQLPVAILVEVCLGGDSCLLAAQAEVPAVGEIVGADAELEDVEDLVGGQLAADALCVHGFDGVRSHGSREVLLERALLAEHDRDLPGRHERQPGLGSFDPVQPGRRQPG